MLGIIGGSGFEKFDQFENQGLLERETPFGLASTGFKKVKVNGIDALFISRHGDHHEHLPSEINYRANIFAMKKNGAKAIVSFSAIGSLEKECAPGDLVIPNQYIDRTKSLRAHTFFGDGLIGHVSLANPICSVMEEKAMQLTQKHTFKTHFKKTYICIEGPYFSTRAESIAYRQIGAQIIGMSNFPEYALAREAGLPYLPCCWVTDYDCWDESIPHVTVDEVIRVMKGNNSKAFALLKDFLFAGENLWRGSTAPDSGLRTGLFMPKEAIPQSKKTWVELLMDSQ